MPSLGVSIARDGCRGAVIVKRRSGDPVGGRRGGAARGRNRRRPVVAEGERAAAGLPP